MSAETKEFQAEVGKLLDALPLAVPR